jgi:hypothetical protein
MPAVAASETGAAQTRGAGWPAGRCAAGVGRSPWGSGSTPAELPTGILAERHWNGRPERVRAP